MIYTIDIDNFTDFRVEVVAEVSCDLARHAADGELKENLDNSTGEDRNSTLIYTDVASYSVSANISDSRSLDCCFIGFET